LSSEIPCDPIESSPKIFNIVKLRLHACGELRHTHAESDSMYAVDLSAILRAEIEDTYVISNEVTINSTNNLLYFI